jgi:hypothetical protein
MRIGPQPKGARGSVGHPYSALNLRFVLAAFGLVTCAVLAGVLAWKGMPLLAGIAGLFAVVALVDLVVIQLRRSQRGRVDQTDHSLFE